MGRLTAFPHDGPSQPSTANGQALHLFAPFTVTQRSVAHHLLLQRDGDHAPGYALPRWMTAQIAAESVSMRPGW
jgi:hypothetical protein